MYERSPEEHGNKGGVIKTMKPAPTAKLSAKNIDV